MKKLLSLSISLAMLGSAASALALSADAAHRIPPRQIIGKVSENGRGAIEWHSRQVGRAPVSRQNVAQAFTAPAFESASLTGVALQIARGRNAVGPGAERAAVTVTLYASGNPGEVSKKDRLFSETTRLPRRLQGGDYLVFDFEKKIKLKKGKRYSVTFEFESPRPAQSLLLAAGSQQSYTAGRAYLYSPDRKHKSFRWEATRENLSLVLLGK